MKNTQKMKINIEIAQIPSYDNSLQTIINNYPNEFGVNTMVIYKDVKKAVLGAGKEFLEFATIQSQNPNTNKENISIRKHRG